jgi:hypothetical protein
LPELALTEFGRAMDHEYSLADSVVSDPELADLFDPARGVLGVPAHTP